MTLATSRKADVTLAKAGDEGGMSYLDRLPRRVVTVYLPLFVFMFVPTCSKGLVNVKRDQAFYESFPWDSKRQHAGGDPSVDLGAISDDANKEADSEKQRLENMGDDYYFQKDEVDGGTEELDAADDEEGGGDDLEGVQL